jgi:hypothetical protein
MGWKEFRNNLCESHSGGAGLISLALPQITQDVHTITSLVLSFKSMVCMITHT